MSTETSAVSGSSGDNAGETADALDKAFDAAIEAVGIEDETYAPSADKMSAKAKPSQPVDDTASEDAAEAESGDEDSDQTEEGKAAKPEPVNPSQAAPAHWDAAKREAFGKLPAEAQKIILDLTKGFEEDFRRKSTEVAEDRRFAQGIRSLITDGHREQLRRSGLDEVTGISRLIQYNDFATRDPAGYARWFIEQTGIDPRQIFPQFAGDQSGGQGYEPAPVDPQFQQLNGTLQQIAQRVAAFERQQSDAKLRTAQSSIQRFRSATDESGAPRYPHLDAVETAMSRILTTDPEVLAIDDFGERLVRAYDLAVYRDPTLRSQLIDSEVQKRTSAQAKQAELAKAKKAKPPVSGAAPVASHQARPKTLDEAMTIAKQQLGLS